MIYILYFMVFAWILYRIRTRETIIDVVLISGLMLPDIRGIESSNFIFVFLLIAITFTGKGKSIRVQNAVIKYVISCLLIMLVGVVSWLCYCGKDISFLIRTSLPVIRYPLIILLVDIYENRIQINVETYINKMYYVVSTLIIVNFFCCIFQKLNKNLALQIFSKLYTYAPFHFNILTSQSKYVRAFGTWDSSMSLGIMSLLCLCILIFVQEFRKKKFWIIQVMLSFIIGVMSLTKTFFIGVVILIISIYLINTIEGIKKNKYSVRDFLFIFCGFTLIFFLVIAFIQIYEWSARAWPHLHYYMGFVMHPLDAFESRLSSRGSLATTVEVVKSHVLFGVGPVPIKGELLGDNAYVVLLHNGGIVAVSIAVWYFGGWVIKSLLRKDYGTVVFLVLWMACGMSLPVLLTMKICMFPASYFLIIIPYLWKLRGDYT